MISLRWVSFALTVSLLLASPSFAGIFSSPLQDASICGDLFIPDEGLADTNVFVGSPHCESLCKKAKSSCDKYVKKIASCYSSWFAASSAFGSRNCSEYEPAAAERECKGNVSDDLQAIKAKVEVSRNNALAECNLWGALCAQDCNAIKH